VGAFYGKEKGGGTHEQKKAPVYCGGIETKWRGIFVGGGAERTTPAYSGEARMRWNEERRKAAIRLRAKKKKMGQQEIFRVKEGLGGQL